ncbi:hypothetical protein LSH36_64g02027 [Paralvinella palmiformis]|uniref:Centrosomal protein of 295 kDa n=1 Tax=Paralvinella palmiformis TaxID=53620 RepID=A0AAD9K5A5_9ANNE|nr:hypothetical protein LSH36_64g02027 [Paralvinella palmiformis]
MKDRIGYRLSPNEEARLLKEARETLRKQRLLQVRERAKLNAAKIRQSVKEEKQKQLQKLAKEIEDEWNREKEEKLRTLKEIYEHNLKHVGEAHRNALQEESKEDNQALTAEVDSRRAQIRHKNALQTLHREVAKQQEEANRHIIARQTALELEKARAAEIASKPPPPPDPVVKIEAPKVRPVKFTDLTAFSATHYHIPEVCYVEKAEPNHQEINALQLAESESEKLAEVEKEQKRSLHEQREKARLRHKHALKKELLKQDYATMLHDLSDLQRADMHRRQLVVAKIPKQIFIPPHRRLEEKEDIQREMEGAFENMYMKATEYFGDLSLALDPHPPPETPSVTESLDLSVQDLDTTITGDQESADPSTGPPVLTDLTNGGKPSDVMPDRTPSGKLANVLLTYLGVNHRLDRLLQKDGYQRLLSRIKAQRQLAQKGSAMTDPDLTEGLRRLVKRIKAQRESSQKSSSGSDKVHTTEDIRDRPSPASQATSLSQHLITDTSPSSATETESLSTGILSSDRSSSLTQGTLTTQSSMSTVSTTTQETDQSEMSASETLSEQETIGSCESSTSTVIDVGKMTNGEKNQLLLHPLEQAAQVRQKVSQYLQDQRERHDNIERKKLMDTIGQETIQSQHELEEQRKLLEEKLQNIEKQRLLVVSRMSELSTREPDTTLNSQTASFYPLEGGTFQHQSSSSSSWRTASSHPPQGSTTLSGSRSAIPQHSFQNGNLPLGSGGYSMADLRPQTVSLEQRDSQLQQTQEYQQELGKKHGNPFNEMMASRQQMADRAQQLLEVNNGVAKDELSPESQPSQFDHLADSSFTQEPMTGSSQHSSERHSVESGLPSSSSVHISGVSELHSTFPRVSDLEERFGVLEDRLRRAGVALAPSGSVDAAMPPVPSGKPESFIQTNGHDQSDSFEKRRNELEAELDKIEKQKASILKQDQIQKEKIQLLKSTWFTMAPDSDESAKQMTSDRFDEPTAEQGKSSGPLSPRRHLSFADSIPDEPSGHAALTCEDFCELDPQRAKLEMSVHHGDVSEKKQLLYHPHEFSYGSSAQRHSSSGVDDEFSWPILQRTGATTGQDPKSDNMSKSGRTWHMELMECSTSSENGSQKSLLKKLPTPPDTDKEPLVFEVEGLHSPLVLRYQAGQESSPSDDNQQLASTPIWRTEADARKEFKSPRSCLSLYTPGSDPQQKLSGGAMSVRFAEQSHHPQEVSLDEENLKQRHSEMSQYAISEESHRLSQPWQQLTTELSQFSLSAHSDSTTRESDRPVSIDEFRPLAALSGSSQLEQVADGDPLKWEQNTQPT